MTRGITLKARGRSGKLLADLRAMERREAAALKALIAPPKPRHRSDCAVNNEPAMPAGPCDCGAT